MSPTIGVITTCHSYPDWLHSWAVSVAGLKRAPDEVVVCALDVPATVDALGDAGIGRAVVVQGQPEWEFGTYLNDAIAACDTDWIVWIGCDDLFLPRALSGWEDTGADVVSFGLRAIPGSWELVRPAPTMAEVFAADTGNLVACGSPFRRRLWEGQPFTTDSFPFNDWAFWISCAGQGATFTATGRVDFLYRVHPAQVRIPDEPLLTQIKIWRDVSAARWAGVSA